MTIGFMPSRSSRITPQPSAIPGNPATSTRPSTGFDAAAHYFVLRVALEHIRPPVWRRLAVPASITLDLLHDVLQVAMGWEDYHLHQFTIAGRRFTEFVADDDPAANDIGENENSVVLGTLIRQAKQKFTYAYDFGDGWQHAITVEKAHLIPSGHEVRVNCLAGRRACPPEDVGGPLGYSRYLEALADPGDEEHQSMLRWRGDFDAENFEIDQVNQRLAWLIRWSRPRKR
jgi:hypothetical protein